MPSLFRDIVSISKNELLPGTSSLIQAANDTHYPHIVDACLGTVKALRTCRKNPGLVQALLEAMARLAYNDDERNSKRDRLGKLGACELIACLSREWSHHVETTKAVLQLVCDLSKKHVDNGL